MTTIRAAIIQAKPVYYDLQASITKALDLIEKAAAQGAQLITLGETWLPGYPGWLDYCPAAAQWNYAPTKAVFARLHENSLLVPSPEFASFANAAKRLGIVLVLSVNECVENGPGHGTLYNTLLTFDATGELVNRHRKLMPTYTERLVWGQGDGTGLAAVPTAVGRVGALVCWEHWMPLARQAVHNSGEQIHIAVWPSVHEMHQVASRHYAFEGRCFVLAAGSILAGRDLPSELELEADLAAQPDTLVQRGGSAIIAPNGHYLAGPVFDEETILCADLDLREIVKEQMTLDVTGHYARPDVFNFSVKPPQAE
jgi:predicted amidohydrolase